MFSLSLLAATAAYAVPTPIIDPAAITADASYPDGYGSPSVTYGSGVYTLYAEAEVAPVGACSETWNVVSFTSTDGLSWTGPTLVRGADATTPCGARSPGAVRLDNGSTVVAFEDVSTGAIGFASGSVSVVPALAGYSQPALVHQGAAGNVLWHLFAVRDSDSATVELSSPDLSTWTFGHVILVPGILGWARFLTESPSWSCRDNATWPYTGSLDGADATYTSFRRGEVRGNWAVYMDGANRDRWLLGSSNEWVSVDILPLTTANFTAWFETIDGAGHPQIGVAGNAIYGATALGRDCAY